MSAPRTLPATNKSAKSSTGALAVPLSVSAPDPSTLLSTIGFGALSLDKLQFVDPTTRVSAPLPDDYLDSITDVIYEKNMNGVTTLTVQANDPTRRLLRSIIKQGTELTITDQGRQITFSFSQLTKASDQIQLAFESNAVYRLLNQNNATGTVTTNTSTAVTEFMSSLVHALNYSGSPYPTVNFVGPDYATVWSQLSGNAGKKVVAVGLGRGTSTDPYESSWTCMTRIASTIAWRLWENNNTVYFGPDEYWLGLLTKNAQGVAVPPINASMCTTGSKIPVMQEFGPDIMLIDFDWDVEKPYAQATVTCMMDGWTYDIGEIVQTQGLGPGNGYWMVYDMQRDLYNPQATLTLQVPMPFAALYDPTSLILPPFPLSAKLV